jgi:hypothetical protein
LFNAELTSCIADFCQNLSVPYFGGEQPGETYYYSPLFVYIFGICDVTGPRARLHAYGYHEGEGGKGGNNVASLLLRFLHYNNWIVEGRCAERLSIVMDNCAGQNKNKMVLRLALMLVEFKYFKRVEFIFYVKGHTKNTCDRMFNLLKLRYHASNVYTMDMLHDTLNVVEDVSFEIVTSIVFWNLDEFFNKFYKNFKAGTVRDNHIFWVDHEQPTVMVSKSFDNDPIEVRFDHNKKINGDRLHIMHSTPRTHVRMPGNFVFNFLLCSLLLSSSLSFFFYCYLRY